MAQYKRLRPFSRTSRIERGNGILRYAIANRRGGGGGEGSNRGSDLPTTITAQKSLSQSLARAFAITSFCAFRLAKRQSQVQAWRTWTAICTIKDQTIRRPEISFLRFQFSNYSRRRVHTMNYIKQFSHYERTRCREGVKQLFLLL